MKKRIISFLLAVCMMITLLPATVLAAEVGKGTASEQASPTSDVKPNVFTDVKEGTWYYDAVRYVQVNGIFDGTGPTTFDPNGTMTRGMFVTVLGRMAGVDKEAYQGESVFSDVAAGQYYAPYVAWAAKHGITGGTGDGTFSPDALINRAQMAAFFVRYFETFGVDYETDANITTTPADIDSVPSWAKDAALKLWKQGLLNGDGTNFNPNGNASRAETATLCMRTDEAIDTWYKEPGVPSERVKIDPATGEAVKGEEAQKPTSGGSSDSDYTTTTYYEVKFAMVAGQSAEGVILPETKLYASGTKITAIPTPYQQDGVFLGWYYDADMATPVGSGDTVNRNMTLYAKMGELTPLSATETPNYMTVTVPAAKVGSYTFGISGYAEGCVEYFTHVSNLNADMTYTVNGTSVRADYKQGQTYSVKLKDDSAAVFVVNGETQPASIRVLNIITEKAEVQNLALDSNVKYLPATSVSNMTGTALDGLFTVSTSTQSMAQNKNEGTFTYVGSGIAVGDTVAIYEGTRPDLRKAVGTNVTNNDGAVAYVKIKSVSGNIYSYETADTEEVLFTPDVLPIPADADTDGDTTNNSITVSADVLDFTDDKYAEMGLGSQTVVEQGDFIAFYSGDFNARGASAPTYAKITDVNESAGNYVITYTTATPEEVMAAMDIYNSRNQKIELTDEEKQQIEDSVVQQAIESGFVEEAAEYLTALAIETDGFQELSDDLDMDLSSYSITFADGTPVDPETMDLMAVKAEITEKSVDANVLLGTLTHFENGTGIRVELVMTFKVEIGSGDNKLVIELQAIFEQEVMLTINVSGGAVWKWAWIIPYIYDYQMNANIDVGTYTGIGITATAKTQGKKDDPPAYDWKPVSGNAGEAKIIDIGKQITDLMQEKDEFMDQFSVPTVGVDGEEAESSGTLTNGGLAEKYAAMIKNAEDSWVDIVRVEIFSSEGYVDMYHILCYGISADFVVQANLYVTIGMTFEYGVAKRYNFSLTLFHKQCTSETIDLEEAHYQFDFYVMGTIGIRAGVEFEIAIGLFSLKLDSIGLAAEVGAYAQLWGYFYYHLSWTESGGKESSCSGAMLIEIGLYLEISFKAQLFSSEKLTYQPTLYENQWPLWSIGEAENVYDFAYEDDDVRLSMDVKVATTFHLPSTLYDMKCLDLKSGDIYGDEEADEPKPAKNYDDETESHYIIELSNPKFTYDAKENMITVAPNGSIDETCEMTITWKHDTLSFSSRPIQSTVQIHWSDPVNVSYINFNSEGGSSAPMVSKGYGAVITEADLPIPTKVGYTFGGWYKDSECTQKFTFPYTIPDYSQQTGVEKGLTLHAKWKPNTDTKYTVEHYQQQLNGTYELFETAGMTGTTDTVTKAAAETYTGFNAKQFQQGTIAPDGSAVVKIYYDRVTYTVAFAYGALSDGNTPLTYTAKYGATVYLPKLALGGYDFVRFEDSSNNALQLNENGGVTVTGNVTYHAVWTPRTDTPYRVEYYLQDTEDTTKRYYIGAQEGFGTTDADVPLNEYKTMENCTYVKAMVNGNDVSGAKISADGKLVIKLYFDRNTFALTYNLGGGTIQDATYTQAGNIVHGKDLVLPVNVTRTGYTFAGWEGVPADGKMPAEALHLTAKWTAGTSAVTLDPNGGTAGTATTVNVTYAEALPAITGLPTRTGYVFAGYYDAADGGKQYYTAEGACVDGVTWDKAGQTVTLYAHWTANQYTAKFNGNGGTGDEMADQTFTYGTAQNLTANTFTKTGYTFGGWTMEGSETVYTDAQEVSNLTSEANGSVTLTAVWTPNEYGITYAGMDGATHGENHPDSHTYGTATVIPAPSKPGYSFAGWTVNDDPTAQKDLTLAAEGYTDPITLTATWEIVTYTITYDLVGGVLADGQSNPATYNVETEDFTLVNPTKTGYDFAGWTGSNGATAQTGVTIAKGSTGDKAYTANWTAKGNTPYTVEYYEMDTNGQYPESATRSEPKAGATDAAAAADTTAPAHFTFDEANGKNVTSGTIAGDVSLVLKVYFERNKYQLTFDGNGGTFDATGTTAKTEQFYYGEVIPWPNAPDYPGYAFNGWDGYTSGTTMPGADTTYKAKWTGWSYSVEFDANIPSDVDASRLTGEMSKQTGFTYGTLNALSENTFALPGTGYTFAGWSTDKNATSAQYGDAEEVSILPSAPVNGSVTLYAVWQKGATVTYTVQHSFMNTDGKTYTVQESQTKDGIVGAMTAAEARTVTGFTAQAFEQQTIAQSGTVVTIQYTRSKYQLTFDANGGTGGKTEQVYYGATITAPADPTRAYYTFDGWQGYADSATMPAAATTYKAGWTGWEYTVVFDANVPASTAVTGTMENQNFVYGTRTALNANQFVRNGYNFLGWSTDPAADSAGYVDQAEIKDNIQPPSKGGTVTLYAVWDQGTPATYTVMHIKENLNGLYVTLEKTETITSVLGATTAADALTLTGFTAKSFEQKTIEAESGTTVTIQYTRNLHKVDVTMNGNSIGASADGEYAYGKTVTVTAGTRFGYTFKSWTNVSGITLTDSQKEAVTITFEMPDSDVTLSDSWSINSYAITYDLDGGKLASGKSNPATYTVDTETFTLNNPTRTGYDFLGWTGSNGATAQTDVTIAKGSTGDKTYTAVWEPIVYTITYNLKDGTLASGKSNPATYTIETETFSLNNPTRDGYTFSGWKGSNGNTARKNVTIAKGSTDNRTYTAVWSAKSYYVDVYSAEHDNTGSYFVGETVTLNAGSKTGYTFSHWEVTGGAELANAYSPETSFTMPAGNVTVTAVWEAIKYNLTFVLNGERYDVQQVKHGEKGTEPAEPKLEGYTFKNWYLQDGTETGEWGDAWYANTETITGHTTVYARMEPKLYSLLIVGGGTGATASGDYPYNSTITLDPGTTAGKYFAGWTVERGNVTIRNNQFTMPMETVELTANWADEAYTVTFMNGGTVVTTQEKAYGDKLTAPESEPGYVTIWQTEDGKVWNFQTDTVTGSMTLVAAGKTPITYTITYMEIVDGGTAAENAPDSGDWRATYTVGGGFQIPIPDPRSGYEFNGWTYEANDSITKNADGTLTIAAGCTGNLTFTANWKTQTVFYINSASDLADWLAANENNTAGKALVLTTDIQLPDGLAGAYEFGGTFDGGGCTINTNGVPLFSDILAGGVVQNLTIQLPATYTCGSDWGAVAVRNYGSIKNCTVLAAVGGTTVSIYPETNSLTLSYAGGIAGINAADAAIENCSIGTANDRLTLEGQGNMTSYEGWTGWFGGIAGSNEGTIKYVGDSTVQSIYVNFTGTGARIGGITGYNSGKVNISKADIHMNADVEIREPDSCVGGVVGMNDQDGTVYVESNNSGKVYYTIRYICVGDGTCSAGDIVGAEKNDVQNYPGIAVDVNSSITDATAEAQDE